MSDPLDALILDLLEWVAAGPRSYAAVMGAWRTSCPRLTVWEDAVDREFVALGEGGGALLVTVTAAGRSALRNAGRQG